MLMNELTGTFHSNLPTWAATKASTKIAKTFMLLRRNEEHFGIRNRELLFGSYHGCTLVITVNQNKQNFNRGFFFQPIPKVKDVHYERGTTFITNGAI